MTMFPLKARMWCRSRPHFRHRLCRQCPCCRCRPIAFLLVQQHAAFASPITSVILNWKNVKIVELMICAQWESSTSTTASSIDSIMCLNTVRLCTKISKYIPRCLGICRQHRRYHSTTNDNNSADGNINVIIQHLSVLLLRDFGWYSNIDVIIQPWRIK